MLAQKTSTDPTLTRVKVFVEGPMIHHKRNYLYTGENTTQVTVSCVRFPSCILQILKQEVVSW